MDCIKKLCYTVGDAIMTIAQKIVIGNKFTVPCANVTPVGDKGTGEGHDAWDDAGDNNIKYPAYLYLTPESIFRNQIASLNPNFINAINNIAKQGISKFNYPSRRLFIERYSMASSIQIVKKMLSV